VVLWSARDDMVDLFGDVRGSGAPGRATSGAGGSAQGTTWPTPAELAAALRAFLGDILPG
jgi:hypothetical protein